MTFKNYYMKFVFLLKDPFSRFYGLSFCTFPLNGGIMSIPDSQTDQCDPRKTMVPELLLLVVTYVLPTVFFPDSR